MRILRSVGVETVYAARIDAVHPPQGEELADGTTVRGRVVNTDKCPGPVSNLKVASETLAGPETVRLGACRSLEDAMSETFF